MTELVSGSHVLGGRFRLVKLLGEGGMGVVWEVEENASHVHYAIKFLKGEAEAERGARRLRREAEAARAIAHPNIVRVIEVAEDDDGSAAIVMELLHGESLGARIERDGPQTLGQTSAILVRVTSALRAAHAAGIVHRDMKPDNVFLVSGPDGAVDVRVLDFGIAKQSTLPAESLTVSGTIMGTPMYMSPEQAAGERGIDARTDVWSLAVIAFECLTGRTPVTGENYGQVLARLIRQDIVRLADVHPDLPPDVLAAIDGALVLRATRSVDLAPMEAAFACHADAAIDKVVPRIVVQSGPSIPVELTATRDTVEALWTPGNSQPEPPHEKVPPPSAARRALVAGAVAFGFTIVLVGAGLLVLTRTSARQTAPTMSSAAAGAAPPPTESSATVAASTAVTASASATSSAPALASARHAPTPRATGAPKHGTTPAGSGPTRLSGGVAGDVPF